MHESFRIQINDKCLSLPHRASLVTCDCCHPGRAEAILAGEYVQRAQPQLQVFNAAELQMVECFRNWHACTGRQASTDPQAYWYGHFLVLTVPVVRSSPSSKWHHVSPSDRKSTFRTQPNQQILMESRGISGNTEVLLQDFHQIALDRPAELGPRKNLEMWRSPWDFQWKKNLEV